MYKQIDYIKAKEVLDNENVILLDVRTEEEFITGHIPNSLLIPLDELKERLEELKDKNAKILVYCKSGRRSALACEILMHEGYNNIYDLGGVVDWPYGLEM